jgi:Ca2+-binding RTX toxin-like protein
LVGDYAINCFVVAGTGLLSNYNVTINPGTLTVTTPSVITTVHDDATNNLIIVGTGGCDTITVNATDPSKITVNGTGSYSVGGGGHVIVYGMACDDNISLIGNINLEAHGGDGNDTITGGAGDDVIFGDTGNDTLTGAAGNDVLVGGNGSDRLVGSAGNDILISGELTGTHNGGAYDYAALRCISTSWAAANASADPDLESPCDDVVDESGSADQLTGSSGHDWFIIGSTDKITDMNSTTKDGDKITYL